MRSNYYGNTNILPTKITTSTIPSAAPVNPNSSSISTYKPNLNINTGIIGNTTSPATLGVDSYVPLTSTLISPRT